MKPILAVLMLLAFAGRDSQAVPNRPSRKELIRADKLQLQGNWVMVRWQRGASVVVYNPNEKFYVWTIRGDRLAARQGALGWSINATFTLDPTQTPKTMDAIELAGPNQGKIDRFIYRLDGDTLTVCHRGIGQARAKDFTGKGGANDVVVVFIKLK
jgi:uncharacterized protein (TIGR03067 family)